MNIRFRCSPHPGFPLSRRELSEVLHDIVDALDLSHTDFSLLLVNDTEMAELNSDFLGLPGPTNVLSFPVEDEAETSQDESSPDYIGEIALCIPALERETRMYGQDPREHLVRLLAHALLHLAGFDHGPLMTDLTEAAVDKASG